MTIDEDIRTRQPATVDYRGMVQFVGDDGVAFSDKDLETAKEKGVNIVSSPLPAYETAVAIARLLDK